MKVEGKWPGGGLERRCGLRDMTRCVIEQCEEEGQQGLRFVVESQLTTEKV